jgi:Major Facilitator Superfamily.
MKTKDIFKQGTGYRAFLLSITLVGLSYGLYKGILDNYLAEIVHIGEFERGVTEFFRELPGLFIILILALFASLSSQTIYRIGGALTLVGLLLCGIVPATPVWAILAVFVYSLGEHIQLPMKSTLTIGYSNKGCSGAALGILNALGHAGNIVGFLVISAVFAIAGSEKTFRAVFFVALAIAALSFLASLGMSNEREERTTERFYFRKKFKKYYMLEVFYGARKQIFLTFGPYVLILFYGAKTETISLLFALAAVSGFVFSPFIGHLIDRIGYKTVMIADTLILVIVCFFYGFAHRLFPMNVAFIICSVNYILDSIISLASMASNVYVEALSDDRAEMRATISTGISVNHLISILIALFGGLIWKKVGIEMLFTLSAVLGLANSAYAATIKCPKNGGLSKKAQ